MVFILLPVLHKSITPVSIFSMQLPDFRCLPVTICYQICLWKLSLWCEGSNNSRLLGLQNPSKHVSVSKQTDYARSTSQRGNLKKRYTTLKAVKAVQGSFPPRSRIRTNPPPLLVSRPRSTLPNTQFAIKHLPWQTYT